MVNQKNELFPFELFNNEAEVIDFLSKRDEFLRHEDAELRENESFFAFDYWDSYGYPVFSNPNGCGPERDDYDDESSYGQYAGSYAQEVMGYSDDEIDDIFDGDPDAYWNID